ncbi:MAG TPA: ABC transporter permease [Candidatus Thioglobus sp.]|jgi:octopine/nopaline transport system permease protein|nr:ABC transporter permease [Candidatus Thioglobus sp.]HIL42272.1 ABC transporter permease [Gammaproteobacteria bacterium]
MEFIHLLSLGDQGWGDEMLRATMVTIMVSISAMCIGLFVSIFGTIAKLSKNRLIRAIGNTYTTVVRGIPELLVIYLLYFGFNNAVMSIANSLFGYNQYIELPVFLIAALAVGIISGAYSTEVIRGAFLVVPRGQIEAAKSVGMNKFLVFYRVLIPQVLRYALPGLGNVWQLTLKDTALIMVTGLVEIMRQAHIASGSTYSPFTFYMSAAILYLVLTTASSMALNSAENWANKGVKREKA